jgi:hypothetical protein
MLADTLPFLCRLAATCLFHQHGMVLSRGPCDVPCCCQVQEAFTFGVALELARARAAEKVRWG